MPHPPTLRLQTSERMLHLVLRAGADATAVGEQEPVASVEAEPERSEEQNAARDLAPALTTISARTTAAVLPDAATLARESRRYCWRRA